MASRWTLRNGGGVRLYEWLRDRALVSSENIPLGDRESVEKHFGLGNPHYDKDIARLRALYDRHAASETVRVKRRLWDNLLRAALGEVAGTRRDLDDLFVRHTYLTAVIGLAVQATFGIDIAGAAEHDAVGLLKGRAAAERDRACTGSWSRTSSPGRPRSRAGCRWCGRWRGGLPALRGPRRRPTSGPACTRRSFRRTSAGSWANTTRRPGWRG